MFKIYISADMEGINGVVYPNQVLKSSESYKFAQKQQHKELNCLIEALLENGAGHITINDAHNTMDNLVTSELNPCVELISGKPKKFSMLAGLDESYDGVIFSGYHAMAGAENGVLAHTFSPIFRMVSLNGGLVGEIALNAIYAGAKKIPIILVTGDYSACCETKKILTETTTVCSKKAISYTAAICRPEEEFLADLRTKTIQSLDNLGVVKYYSVIPPYLLEIEFADRRLADVTELLPCVKRFSESGVSYESVDFEEVYRLLQFFSASLGTL